MAPIQPMQPVQPGQVSGTPIRGFTYKGHFYEPGVSKAAALLDGQRFIGIDSIVEDKAGRKIINGPLYRNALASDNMDMMPLGQNEVVRYKNHTHVSSSILLRPRVLILTNMDYPAWNNYAEHGVCAENANLVCRWHIELKPDPAALKMNMSHLTQGRIERLGPSEVIDPLKRLSWQKLREQYVNLDLFKERPDGPVSDSIVTSNDTESISASEIMSPHPIKNEEFKAGKESNLDVVPVWNDYPDLVTNWSHAHTRSAAEMIGDDVDPGQDRKRMMTSRETHHKYTFGDCFCGAGGASCGARAAGLALKWGLDNDFTAIRSYTANFFPTRCYSYSVEDFLENHCKDEHHVDVLHFSPPCQAYSMLSNLHPASVTDIHIRASTCIAEFLTKIRPRVATLETVEGILQRPRRHWFSTMVRQFIINGYSVKWDLLRCPMFGVPQDRKRLIIIAARPGDYLPDFPKPTHKTLGKPTAHSGASPSLEEPVTIRKAFSQITSDLAHDDCYDPRPWSAIEGPRKSTTFLAWDRISPCLTNGRMTSLFHPDENRLLTIRELACICSFPVLHIFHGGTDERRQQIANAVPPLLSQAIYGEVIKSLEATDSGMRDKTEAETANGNINEGGS
ncbi:S-adenosyl-L-methionine-dependent methyltransferase [Geopyxis carbonaria]|nr:S-adenosyl-L-methionine-dependent methyltransferase [Geopyxis carbonaria]